MISIEEVRQVVIAEFQAAHDAAYITTLVNYENFTVVDIEHQRDPFVSVELEITESGRGEIGEKEIFVAGALSPVYYYQEGRGGQGHLTYTDHLNTALGMQSLNGVYYHAVKPIRVITFPGWVGTMNRIEFQVVDTGCSL